MTRTKLKSSSVSSDAESCWVMWPTYQKGHNRFEHIGNQGSLGRVVLHFQAYLFHEVEVLSEVWRLFEEDWRTLVEREQGLQVGQYCNPPHKSSGSQGQSGCSKGLYFEGLCIGNQVV